jgi:hypothetical protein
VGVVVVGVVVVAVVAQEVFYISPDLRMSELRKLGSVCIKQTSFIQAGNGKMAAMIQPCCMF